jgi:hypothetical protein
MRPDLVTDRTTDREDLAGLHDDETVLDSPEIRARKLLPVVLTVALCVPLILILGLVLRPEGTLRITRWPNGYKRTEVTYQETPLGLVPEGPARAWHENGHLAEEGLYEAGEPTGPWRLYDQDGRQTTEAAPSPSRLPSVLLNDAP